MSSIGIRAGYNFCGDSEKKTKSYMKIFSIIRWMIGAVQLPAAVADGLTDTDGHEIRSIFHLKIRLQSRTQDGGSA